MALALADAASEIDLVGESFEALTDRVSDFSDRTGEAGEVSTEVFGTIGEAAHAQIGAVAAGAFDAYADAIDKAIDTGEFSVKSFGNALRNILAQALKAIGTEAAIKGALELANAAAAIAGVVTAWKAPGHFAAAAAYFGVAAAAGAGAGALSTGGGGGGAGGGGVEPRGAEAAEGDELSIYQEVTLIGALDARDAELLHDQLQEAEEKRDLS